MPLSLPQEIRAYPFRCGIMRSAELLFIFEEEEEEEEEEIEPSFEPQAAKHEETGETTMEMPAEISDGDISPSESEEKSEEESEEEIEDLEAHHHEEIDHLESLVSGFEEKATPSSESEKVPSTPTASGGIDLSSTLKEAANRKSKMIPDGLPTHLHEHLDNI